MSKPTVKQHLAAHPHAVRLAGHRPGHSHQPGARGARPQAHREEGQDAGALGRRDAGSCSTRSTSTTLIGLRDRALIALMVYTFARVGAALSMKVEDYYIQKRRGWVRLHEKGGKVNELPCHHNLEQFLDEWLPRQAWPANRPLPCSRRCGMASSTGRTPLPQANVHMMIQRRATRRRHPDQDRRAQLPRHRHHHVSEERGKLEIAQQMAGHESARTTGLYDRRNDSIALDEVERIAF